jgi:chloride channel 3/4/5
MLLKENKQLRGLSSPTAMWENVFLLVLTGVVKIGFTAWTFGMMV